MASDAPIIIYHYKFSPYARRVAWYLAIRGIPYTECLQPPILPRPDVAGLGIAYRRIPLLSIGRDVYLDTRLQLCKLEESPRLAAIAPPLAADGPDSCLITRLLERWCVDAGLFASAAALIPQDLPVTKDPKFAKDRADFFGAAGAGGQASPEAAAQAAKVRRAEALSEIRSAFAMLEGTVFADGREWVMGGPGPTTADIEAVWVLHWLVLGLPGALKDAGGKQYVVDADFPRVFAWIKRFDGVVKGKNARPTRVKGEEARKMVAASGWNEDAKDVDGKDSLVMALGLKKGDHIIIHPTDTGRNHKDAGTLVAMTGEEIVWETQTQQGDVVRVHAPRHGFRVRKAEGPPGKL